MVDKHEKETGNDGGPRRLNSDDVRPLVILRLVHQRPPLTYHDEIHGIARTDPTSAYLSSNQVVGLQASLKASKSTQPGSRRRL